MPAVESINDMAVHPTPDMIDATRNFERWVRGRIRIVEPELRRKHQAMRQDPFSFLRATYYRWAQRFVELNALVVKAPRVLSVGDLHIENFGTWRDGLGRLAWGINDFDEAFPLAYTNDLVRLATSALVAIDQDELRLGGKAACGAILEGYREAIAAGGRPFVIGEDHRWFKPILNNPERDPGVFWDKLHNLPRERSAIPAGARAAIAQSMPDGKLKYEVHHRVAGLGNLGKPRYTAISRWLGGPVAREAKALTVSATAWAQSSSAGPFYEKILAGAVRSPDPFLIAKGEWIVRRLAPDCRRLELSSLERVADEEWLLHAMGFETANVHLGTKSARGGIARHLSHFSKSVLRRASMKMKETLLEDFRRWRGGR